MAGVEQAAVDAPLPGLLAHVGHRANLDRQAGFETAPRDNDAARARDQRHRGRERGDLERARPAEPERNFDEAIGGEGEQDAQPQDQLPRQRRQRREIDEGEEDQ